MPELPELFTVIWGQIPEALRPFLLPAIVVGLIYYMLRDKRSRLEAEADAWDTNVMQTVRADNDRMTGRMRELEESYPRLRGQYDAVIAQLNKDNTAEHNTLTHDRDRGWDLARAWCDYAHHLRHWINNQLMLIPESIRPQTPAPLPSFEGMPTKRPDEFPSRFQTGSPS